MASLPRPLPSARRAFRVSAGLAALAAALLLAPPAMAAPAWLIASANENAAAGQALRLEVAKPASLAAWPSAMNLRLIVGERLVNVPLAPAGAVSPDGARRPYQGRLPADISGLVRVELADRDSNRLALLAATPEAGMEMAPHATAEPEPEAASYPDEPVISANEPMYFVLGNRGGVNARFQLSFKYRLVEPDGTLGQALPWLRNLHFGYTQTSLWDLGEESKPFRDTSYRPSLFWQWNLGEGGAGLRPYRLRAGYEHESNGKDGASSRSIDMLFVQPAWRWDFNNGTALTLAPKLYGYLDREDNPDIARYRGHADWIARYGKDDGWLLAAQMRRGTAGKGNLQLDLSYPLRDTLFARAGGFLHFQLFSGYGESLLDYNRERDTQLRIGFSIVR